MAEQKPVKSLNCLRCGHTWYGRDPVACPACKSYRWKTPKKNQEKKQ